MIRHWFLSFLSLSLLSGCAELHVGRTYLSEMEHDDSTFFSPSDDFPIVAGDTGRNWISDDERRERTPAAEEEDFDARKSRYLKQELKDLEGLQSEDSLAFYERHKGQLTTTSERIYFLKLPSYERKDYLLSRGFIEETKPKLDYKENLLAVRNNDILLGMKKDDVLSSWGKPLRVEVAGNPRHENERWLYRMNGASKYIYFESGEVQGWE